MQRILVCLVIWASIAGGVARAGEDPALRRELEALKREVAEIRKDRPPAEPPPVGRAESLVENKYGPGAPVTSKQGKLILGGLCQVWYYSIRNDSLGWVDTDKQGVNTAGSNETSDNDGFRLRRTRLLFTMNIHENVTAFVMINAAGEVGSVPSLPSNQLYYANAAYVNPGYAAPAGAGIGSLRNAAVQAGAASVPRDLEEAWINYHGVIPHHDWQFGQMIRQIGEEGPRPSGQLDFVERAMINQYECVPGIGGQVHGSWWDERFQYWLGAFDGAGSAFEVRFNRANDNDAEDFLSKVLVRPLWKNETWGSLELGYSLLYGKGGEAGGHRPADLPVNGLNFPSTVHVNQHVWGAYMPGGPVKGWWLRGEWAQYRDRFRVNQVISYPPTLGLVRNPAPFDIHGWYASTGYKLADSIFAKDLDHWVKPLEFTFRYEEMENLFFADLQYPSRRFDIWKTHVYTAGLNYYIKGHNAKIQVNYNWVREDHGGSQGVRQLREVSNDSFIVNFQVGW